VNGPICSLFIVNVMSITHVDLQERLTSADGTDPDYATRQVNLLLHAAQEAGASDVHLQPLADGLRIDWRIDGVLQPLVTLSGAR